MASFTLLVNAAMTLKMSSGAPANPCQILNLGETEIYSECKVDQIGRPEVLNWATAE